ncbi:MAG: hypothetical protein ACHQ3P_02100 [Candidatus Limnocylindrales bacterium]
MTDVVEGRALPTGRFGAQILAVSQATMPEIWGFPEMARMEDPAEQARLESEGAALTLDEAIDLALSIGADDGPARPEAVD